MEAESENHTNVRLFWDILNECLRKVSGKRNYKFNPVGWCTDMAGANLAGLSEVFGETVTDRMKTCEFHFKDHGNKNARKLDPVSAVEFKTLCDNLLLSATEGAYERAKAEMDAFIAAKEERSFLTSWISWWHARRGFIFSCICSARRATNESSRSCSRWMGPRGPPQFVNRHLKIEVSHGLQTAV